MPDRDFSAAFDRIKAAAAAGGLLGVEETTSYGTPSLKVGSKSLLRLKDPDTLVLLLPMVEKEALMDAAPEIYFETAHYRGYPAVLVALSRIDDRELAHRLLQAWRHRAPRRLVAARDRVSEGG
jgi:hypothetical protein